MGGDGSVGWTTSRRRRRHTFRFAVSSKLSLRLFLFPSLLLIPSLLLVVQLQSLFRSISSFLYFWGGIFPATRVRTYVLRMPTTLENVDSRACFLLARRVGLWVVKEGGGWFVSTTGRLLRDDDDGEDDGF